MDKTYTGKEICNKYSDLENDLFGTEEHRFVLTKMAKEQLYDVPCAFSKNGKNLVRLEEWFADPENYDNYHTDNINQMIDCLRAGDTLPPLIIDKKLGLYDGQHRLTAYSMVAAAKEIAVYKEI